MDPFQQVGEHDGLLIGEDGDEDGEGFTNYEDWSLHLLLHHGLLRKAVRNYEASSNKDFSTFTKLHWVHPWLFNDLILINDKKF